EHFQNVRLELQGKDLEKDVLGFINNLNHSKSFSNAFIGGETKEAGGKILFPLTVDYHPDVARIILVETEGAQAP
ncbi:hypothetical protein ACFLU6_15320, partial [Acidobacteriota bacterium]